jgi:RNA polymerase sigma-70 factor (ECF subfamily)
MGRDLETTLDLIERARLGDRDALERLFARFLPPLRRWASGRLPQRARGLTDTDDLVQDTLLRTFRRIEAFEVRHVGALQAYLRQAVMNRLRDELRRQGCRPRGVTLDDEYVAESPSPLEAAIGSQAAERYERALERLTPGDREAIIARLELGLDYDELADALGKPTPDAARKAARRALLRLAAEMEHDLQRTASKPAEPEQGRPRAGGGAR